MASIAPHIIYAKTAKGSLEVANKTMKLQRELGLVFLSVNGRTSVAELLPVSGMTPAELEQALETLVAEGYVQEIAATVQQIDATTDAARTDLDLSSSKSRSASETQPRNAPRPDAEASKGGHQERRAALDARLHQESKARARVLSDTRAPGETEGRKKAEARAARVRETAAELPVHDLAEKLKAKVQAERRARDLGETYVHAGGALTDDAQPPKHQAAAPPQEPKAESDRDGKIATPSHISGADIYAPTPFSNASQERPTNTEATYSSAQSEPGALERAMMKRGDTTATTALSAAETSMPALDDSEPLHERLNVDRAAHDVLAHAADARRQAEAGLPGRHLTDVQQHRMDEDARRTARGLRRKRREKAWAAAGLAVLIAPVLAILCLQYVPLNGYIPDAEQALSERFNEPTRVSTVRYVMLPSPRVILEGVTAGKTQSIRVNRVEAPLLPHHLFDQPRVFDTVEAHGVTIDAATLGAIPTWTGGRSASAMKLRRLELTDAKVDGAAWGLAPLSGAVTFEANGTLHQAYLGTDKLRIDVAPEGSGLRVALTAQDSRVPFGPPVNFTHLTIIGVASPSRFTSSEVSGRIAGGSVVASLKARWDGPIVVGGDFKLHNARLQELVALLTPDFSTRGIVKASGRYTFQAINADALMAKPLVEATFSVARGELTNIDLVRAIQASGSSSFSGGRTGFDELSGSLQVAEGNYAYRHLELSSTPLHANGQLVVAPGGQLSGRVNAQVALSGAAATRAALTVGGTVKEPQLGF